jgi:hypothetical protein
MLVAGTDAEFEQELPPGGILGRVRVNYGLTDLVRDLKVLFCGFERE